MGKQKKKPQVGGSVTTGRMPWVDLPTCGDCHDTGIPELEPPATRFRDAVGHGGPGRGDAPRVRGLGRSGPSPSRDRAGRGKLGGYGRTQMALDVYHQVLQAIHDACVANLENSVKDPVLRERLRPDYQVASKRLIMSEDFYEKIQRPNATLVTNWFSVERLSLESAVRSLAYRPPRDDVLRRVPSSPCGRSARGRPRPGDPRWPFRNPRGP